ncbi:unnamed protein product [Protopolystoma xenopodis]|uniref:Secreted protein n=1 Tax=Protopolystoma xenopodis TaxID=117903 RepID=A0A448WIM2_9PLAT|nr:unnamed protein product [Protopolystoma xenopodis]
MHSAQKLRVILSVVWSFVSTTSTRLHRDAGVGVGAGAGELQVSCLFSYSLPGSRCNPDIQASATPPDNKEPPFPPSVSLLLSRSFHLSYCLFSRARSLRLQDDIRPLQTTDSATASLASILPTVWPVARSVCIRSLVSHFCFSQAPLPPPARDPLVPTLALQFKALTLLFGVRLIIEWTHFLAHCGTRTDGFPTERLFQFHLLFSSAASTGFEQGMCGSKDPWPLEPNSHDMRRKVDLSQLILFVRTFGVAVITS